MTQPTYSALQKRVIRSLIRRNLRGWGKPLAYSQQRLRLALPLGVFALICFALESLIGGAQQILQPTSGFTGFLTILGFLGLAAAVGTLAAWLPKVLGARNPPQSVTGTINAVICDPETVLPFPDISHFITLRLDNGSLRAFAISPSLHDQVCQMGKRVTLTVMPGTEEVVAVA